MQHYFAHCVAMKIIIVQFILNPEKNQQAAGNAQRKTKNIDERESFILHQIPPCGFEIIFYHSK
jgi:hypothetical protein